MICRSKEDLCCLYFDPENLSFVGVGTLNRTGDRNRGDL